MKKILITGLTGFVGSHLAEYCLTKVGVKIFGTILSYQFYDELKRIKHIRNKIELFKIDLADKVAVRKILKKIKPDKIFHLAAQSVVKNSWDKPEYTLLNNTMAELNIFEALRELKLNPVIHIAGSSEEYGLIFKNELPVRETNPLRPLSPYAVSKITQEMLAFQYYRSYGLKTVTTRAFNHDGPRRGKEYVTSNFARQIVAIEKGKQGPVIKTGNLNIYRDYSDVRDIVRAYWLATEKCKYGEPYNIGSGKVYQIKEILKILLSYSSLGDKIKIRKDPKLMRPSDIPIIQCNSAKFRKITGWKPKIDFRDTLKDILNYWRNNL